MVMVAYWIRDVVLKWFEQVEEGSVIGNVNIVSAINEILTSGGGSIETRTTHRRKLSCE